jgi:hypothetical protein
VTAGAHWNKIDSEGIEKVLCNGDILAGMILEKLAACSDKADEET